MGIFLKLVSAIYLLLIWIVAIGAFRQDLPLTSYTSDFGSKMLILAVAVGLSIPAAALYGFGQMVGDVRAMRGHLKAMRKYYEPADRLDGL